jgi:hypothetical protein
VFSRTWRRSHGSQMMMLSEVWKVKWQLLQGKQLGIDILDVLMGGIGEAAPHLESRRGA